MGREGLLQRGVAVQGDFDGGLGCDGREEGEVAGALGLEQGVGSNLELGEIALSRLHFRLRHAADEVGLHSSGSGSGVLST